MRQHSNRSVILSPSGHSVSLPASGHSVSLPASGLIVGQHPNPSVSLPASGPTMRQHPNNSVFLPASGLSANSPASGLYVLLLRLKKPVTIRVGALGSCAFPKGWYLYTGSARRGLGKRVARHFAAEKPLRWHIDYLSTAAGAIPLGAVLIPMDGPVDGPGHELGECEANRRVGALIEGRAPLPRFGASDCRARCPAHLWHTPHAVDGAALTAAFPGGVFLKG